MNNAMTIGKLAKAARVNIQTVLYYERRGILRPAARKPSGYRLYAPEAAQRIRFLKNAQSLGFSLGEASEMLRLRVKKGARPERVRAKVERKLMEVREKIARLESMRKTLKRLIVSCCTGRPSRGCSILDAFAAGGL